MKTGNVAVADRAVVEEVQALRVAVDRKDVAQQANQEVEATGQVDRVEEDKPLSPKGVIGEIM